MKLADRRSVNKRKFKAASVVYSRAAGHCGVLPVTAHMLPFEVSLLLLNAPAGPDLPAATESEHQPLKRALTHSHPRPIRQNKQPWLSEQTQSRDTLLSSAINY